MDKILITNEGCEKLKNEIKHLKEVERPKVIEAIASAREMGDLSENAEYHSARERQGHLEATIIKLEDKLARSEVVDISRLSGKKVQFGATVVLQDINTEKKVTYKIVSEYEANIDDGLISLSSPVAKAVTGKDEGDEVEINTPGGTKDYEILKVEFK
ncbi:transcription elongation factor GreA [Pseudomonadota bacterium]